MAYEPWLRDTLKDVPVVARAVLHSLQMAQEDLRRWCGDLSDAEVHATPGGLPSVSFQLRHIAGSLDRLLTYAEDRDLSEAQLKTLAAEKQSTGAAAEILNEATRVIEDGARRVRRLASLGLDETRLVGREKLPTTLGGLLAHVAEHTQRHVGQAITTVKILRHGRDKTQ